MKKNILYIILGIILVIGISIYYFNFRMVKVEFVAKIGPGIAPVSVRVGSTIDEPTTPESSEYRFLGWYLDDELFDFSKPITKNIVLEAKWEKIIEP